MINFTSKKLLAAVTMGLALSFAGASYAAPVDTSVSVQVSVEQSVKGNVNWEKGASADVEAIGVGMAPDNMPTARGMAMARRAAIVDAYRYLAETINAVQVDAETTMNNLTVESDIVKTKVNAIIRGAKIIEEFSNSDGSYTVKMSVPLYGVGSVAAVAIPEANKTVLPAEAPVISDGYVPSAEVQAAAYTGVIVDASGMGLEGTFSPIIYDVNGRAIYGMRNIDKDFAISKGMVEYAGDVQNAVVSSRAGANPLVVRAVAVKGGTNSVNPVNVVVSVEDGDAILYANERAGFLDQKAVVFVK